MTDGSTRIKGQNTPAASLGMAAPIAAYNGPDNTVKSPRSAASPGVSPAKGPMSPLKKSGKGKPSSTKAPVFAAESTREMFDRYDVDGSGMLDFQEVSVALADMGVLEGVLASAAAELFEEFDADGSGTVDFEEFTELTAKVKELKGSNLSKPAPEVPAGFEESAGSLPLRRSFEAFAAFGKGSKVAGTTAAEVLAGRDWAKLVKDCGLIGGALNSTATDIIFARAVPKGKRVLRWDDGTFLLALAHVAAEHRVTFGQVATRVAQCTPQRNVEAGHEEASRAGAEERAAASAARAAAEAANGPAPEPAAISRAALAAIFERYALAAGNTSGSASVSAIAPVDALHALADVGLLRGVSPSDAQIAITTAISESSDAAGGKVEFEPFANVAPKLVTARGSRSYEAPEAIHLPLDQRHALQASFRAFGGGTRGMDGASWEKTVRECGLIGPKVNEATAAVIFAKCKDGAGSGAMAPKAIGFPGFVQAAAHIAQAYDVKFEMVAQRVIKCTPAVSTEDSGVGPAGNAAVDAGEAIVKLAAPVEIPADYRSHPELSDAFALFATQNGGRVDTEGWGKLVRACGLVGGSLTDAMAQEIFVQSGAPQSASGGMGWDEFLWSCAVVGATHGVMFKVVAARVISVAQRQGAAQKAAAAEEAAAAAAAARPQLVQKVTSPPKKTKKKKSSMFSMFK